MKEAEFGKTLRYVSPIFFRFNPPYRRLLYFRHFFFDIQNEGVSFPFCQKTDVLGSGLFDCSQPNSY